MRKIMAMKVFTIALTTFLLLVISGCGYNPERDNNCPGCDLTGADLTGANLYKANLRDANLAGVNLSWANTNGPSRTTTRLYS